MKKILIVFVSILCMSINVFAQETIQLEVVDPSVLEVEYPAASKNIDEPAKIQEVSQKKQSVEKQKTQSDTNSDSDAADIVADRFAVGFSMVSSVGVLDKDIPSFAARYWFDRYVGAELYLGFTTGDSQDSIIAGGKVLGIIQSFDSFNVFVSATGAMGSIQYNGRGYNGFFKIAGAIGVEWFILKDLSVSTEMGIGFFDAANISKQLGFYADWLPQVGLRYYL